MRSTCGGAEAIKVLPPSAALSVSTAKPAKSEFAPAASRYTDRTGWPSAVGSEITPSPLAWAAKAGAGRTTPGI